MVMFVVRVVVFMVRGVVIYGEDCGVWDESFGV